MNADNKAEAAKIEQALQCWPKGRYPSVSFEDIWHRFNDVQGGRQRAVRSKTVRAWCVLAAALLLLVPVGFSSPVRAALNDFIEVHLLKSKRGHASIVHHWDVQRMWDEAKTYDALDDAARSVGVPFPIPAKLAEYEKDALNKEYRVTTEHGQITGYFFSIRTRERMLDVTAKYREPAAPSFTVESRAQAIVKETTVNGQPAKLFAVREFAGYTLYFAQDGWQFVITGYASGVGGVEPAPFTESEMMQIAESIRFDSIR